MPGLYSEGPLAGAALEDPAISVAFDDPEKAFRRRTCRMLPRACEKTKVSAGLSLAPALCRGLGKSSLPKLYNYNLAPSANVLLCVQEPRVC